MEVLSIGSAVTIGYDDDIPGRIVAICVRANEYVRYEIEWWTGRERKSEWFDDGSFGFDPHTKETENIGFIQ